MSHNNEIDPEILEFMAFLENGWAEHTTGPTLTLNERRQNAEIVRSPLTSGGPTFDGTKEYYVDAGGGKVRVRIMNTSPGESRPAVVYLHGGGWMLFSIDTHDRIMRELAAEANIALVGIDYSLAPEYRFPSQLTEIRSVIDWLRSQGDAVGIDRDKLFIGGDSAGANLTVASCLGLRDNGQIDGICGMILCYGVYDSNFDTASYQRYAESGLVLSRDEMIEFWQCYAREALDYHNPLAAPLHADLTGLPPTTIVIAEHDVLYDENLQMALKLESCGVEVTSKVYPGTTHSFLEAVSMAAVSRQAIADIAHWLQKTLRHI